ncbi:MAG TPA: bile acid:sodium symporter family protein [Kiritimatiellia bacterium]|nr:bile acid:sodium symporter family protein [Kiritimatiellia bacterium]
MNRRLSAVTTLFPLWALLASAWAYLRPAPWAALQGWIVPLLGLVMFGMGLTLTGADFRRVFQRPGPIVLGMAVQFGLMPLLALGLARVLHLAPPLVAGMVLVGCVSGGTASNVITWLARGDTALSITMTFCSTVLAVAATPALTWLYLHQTVPVPAAGMLLSILQIVLLPVLAGMAVNRFLGRRLARFQPAFPLLSVAAIVLIIGIIIGLNHDKVATTTPVLVLAVCLHNLGGMACGYAAGRLFRCPPVVCRTLAIEVGMQNSGLAVTLAVKHFSAAAALPGALFSILHNLSGSAFAAWHNRRRLPEPAP